MNFLKSSFWRIFTNLAPLCSSSRLAKQFFTVDRAASLLMSTGVYPITESRVRMWELGNWMERVESSFLLLPQFQRLKFTDFTYQWSKSSAPPGAAGCGRLARRGVVPCSVRATGLSSAANERKAGPVWNFLRGSLCCGGCDPHCLNYFDFSSQFTCIPTYVRLSQISFYASFLIRILVMNMGLKSRTVNDVATSLENPHH